MHSHLLLYGRITLVYYPNSFLSFKDGFIYNCKRIGIRIWTWNLFMVEASNEIWDCIALKITSFYVGLVNILSFWEGYVSQNHVKNGLFHNPKFTNAILSLGCISERISHSKLYWTIQHNVIWRQVSTFQSSFKNMRKHIMFPTQKLHIRRKIDIWYFSSSYFQLTRVIRR